MQKIYIKILEHDFQLNRTIKEMRLSNILISENLQTVLIENILINFFFFSCEEFINRKMDFEN